MFRFTIRELVLLTLVVAMGVGWWLDRSRWKAKLAASEIKAIEINRVVDLLLADAKRVRQAIEENGHVWAFFRRG